MDIFLMMKGEVGKCWVHNVIFLQHWGTKAGKKFRHSFAVWTISSEVIVKHET